MIRHLCVSFTTAHPRAGRNPESIGLAAGRRTKDSAVDVWPSLNRSSGARAYLGIDRADAVRSEHPLQRRPRRQASGRALGERLTPSVAPSAHRRCRGQSRLDERLRPETSRHRRRSKGRFDRTGDTDARRGAEDAAKKHEISESRQRGVLCSPTPRDARLSAVAVHGFERLGGLIENRANRCFRLQRKSIRCVLGTSVAPFRKARRGFDLHRRGCAGAAAPLPPGSGRRRWLTAIVA